MYRYTARLVGRLFIPTFLFLTLTANVNAQVIDRILVLVNDEVITESEFVSKLRFKINELRASKQELPDQNVIESNVMEGMILESIQLQIADLFNITVEDSQLDRAIGEIAVRQKVSVLELMERVRDTGMSQSTYRNEIYKQLRIQRVIDREVRRGIVVTDKEIDTWLGTKGSNQDSEVKYEVAHISLTVNSDDESSFAEIRQRAEKILVDINSGSKFEVLARRFSDSGDADNGGYIGWRGKDELPDIFYETVSGMDVGQVSNVMQSAGGVHILQLLDRRGGGRYVVDQWNTRHILVTIDSDTSESEALEQAKVLRERLLQSADFATLANVHSDDNQSRFKGGDLGWVSPGDTVPEFEEMLRNLPLNTVSQPIRTRFGFHLVELLDRRSHDIGKDRLRLQAERQLREQKGKDVFDQWITRIREEAYVKFRVKPQG